MFRFATSQTHFYFDGKIFDQVDGVAMGSPLGPASANLFIGHNEQKWLESDHGRLVKFYRRYVDDIFCAFENEHQAMTFLDFLNSQHPNLNFTLEKEHMKQLPFLDVLSTLSDRLLTSVYSTFTGLGMVNTWNGFHLDLEKLKVVLQKNEYPQTMNHEQT